MKFIITESQYEDLVKQYTKELNRQDMNNFDYLTLMTDEQKKLKKIIDKSYEERNSIDFCVDLNFLMDEMKHGQFKDFKFYENFFYSMLPQEIDKNKFIKIANSKKNKIKICLNLSARKKRIIMYQYNKIIEEQ